MCDCITFVLRFRPAVWLKITLDSSIVFVRNIQKYVEQVQEGFLQHFP